MSFPGVVGFLLYSFTHCVIMSMYSFIIIKSIKAISILKKPNQHQNPCQPEGHGNQHKISERIKHRRTKGQDQMRK